MGELDSALVGERVTVYVQRWNRKERTRVRGTVSRTDEEKIVLDGAFVPYAGFIEGIVSIVDSNGDERFANRAVEEAYAIAHDIDFSRQLLQKEKYFRLGNDAAWRRAIAEQGVFFPRRQHELLTDEQEIRASLMGKDITLAEQLVGHGKLITIEGIVDALDPYQLLTLRHGSNLTGSPFYGAVSGIVSIRVGNLLKFYNPAVEEAYATRASVRACNLEEVRKQGVFYR